jgi:hypothetical protein
MTTPCAELGFIATGGNQHVFEDLSGDSEWVFKIPAAFGRIVPWNHQRRLRRAEPRNRAYRLIYRALFAPRGTPLDSRIEPVGAAQRMWARYIERNASRRFHSMLRIMDTLSRCGGADLLLPYTVESGPVVLHMDGRIISYPGPVLRQRRAVFRRVPDVIADNGWDELVSAQHRLWRFGVATADVIRHTSWALHDGRPCIADGDSLTTRTAVAQGYVSPAVLDRERDLVRRVVRQTGSDVNAEAFLTFMARHINRQALQAQWKHGAAGQQPASTGVSW